MDLSEQQKPLLKQTIQRRSRAAMKALYAQIRDLNATGKLSRKQIALQLGINPSTVTLALGARSRWKWVRST